jgi:NADPH2:quinone reductase
VGPTYTISTTAAAHQLQEDNTLRKQGTLAGKIVIVPDSR